MIQTPTTVFMDNTQSIVYTELCRYVQKTVHMNTELMIVGKIRTKTNK